MNNPLTGFVMPSLYVVEIYYRNHILASIQVKTTNEEEAVAQAVKLLTTRVRKLNGT
jgi:hypothetical protein